jgi:hypothetical protein
VRGMGLRPGVLIVNTGERQDIMGSNTPKRNRSDQATAERALLAGLLKHAQAVPSLLIAGVWISNGDMVARLQARLDTAGAVQSTRATWIAAVQEERAERARTRRFVSNLRQVLLVAFDEQVDALADFGLTTRRQHARTPDENLGVTTKSRATRAARHTMGPKQRAAIRG